MNKNQRIARVLYLINTLNDLWDGISKRARFEYRLESNSIFVNGLSDDLAHLYLLLHSGVENVCVYLQHGSKGIELEIMVLQ